MTCVICNESLSTQQSCTIYLITIKLWVTLCVHFGEFNWKGFRSSYLSHCATEQKLLVLLENPFLLVSYIYTSNNFHVHFNLDKFNNFDDFKPYWWLFMALHFYGVTFQAILVLVSVHMEYSDGPCVPKFFTRNWLFPSNLSYIS